jgi:hypothetical protein
MKLIPLDSVSASLEFSSDDWSTVKERLRRLGPVRRSRRAGHSRLDVGGISLLFMNEEWDGYALIAQDLAGVELLNQIANLPPLAHAAE